MNRLTYTILAISITAAALVYALWGVDFRKLIELLSGGNYLLLAPLLGLLTLFFWFKALRWVVILRPLGRFTWTQVTPAMMIGFAANNILPARLGEFLRTVVFARNHRQPISGVFISLVLERILDIIGILFLYFIAVVMIGTLPEGLELGAWIIALLMGGITVCIAILLLFPGPIISLWQKLSTPLPTKLRTHGTHMLQHGIQALSSLKSPVMVVTLLMYTLLQWSIMTGIVWLSLSAFGTTITLSVTLLLLAVLTLAVTVPGAPGYIGAIQAAFVFALVPFGIPKEVAFAASVFYLVGQWVPVTAVGALFFVSNHLSVSAVRQDIQDAEKASESS